MEHANRALDQGPNVFELEQTYAGLLQRGEVRDESQAQRLTQRRPLEQELGDAAIVLLLELLEHQAGEELRLGELVWTGLVGIVAEGFLAGGQRDPRHRPWRLA